METGRESVRTRAFAKINLGLEILGKREDGYHLLRSGMQTVSLADELILTKTEEEGIRLRCDRPSLPTDERNLAVRAVLSLFRHCELKGGVQIELRKEIPEEAGLGGGSAVKLTTQHYYTPNGYDLHGKGVAPDVEVKSEEGDVLDGDKDAQLSRALEVLQEE